MKSKCLGEEKGKASEKKSIAFNALTDGSDSNNDNDEEIAFMTKNFRKFLKYRKMNNLKRNNYKNSGNQNVVPNYIKCFNCDEPGHIKRDCPHPDKQNLPINNDSAKKRKRAFTATLDDSDSYSSNDDQKTDNSNLCFTAIHDLNKFKETDSEKGTHLQYN